MITSSDNFAHKRNFAVLGLFLLVTGFLSYRFFIFETPEECFVREMKVWSESKGISDMVKGITQDDAKMSVASAKVKTDEADYDKIQDEQKKKIYLRVKTLFEYCEIK